ncbi:MAG: dihydrodipicolinate reductase [Acidimicrobiia bacterium]|nr:dihydrodipicolinate reductase [Acidimicrobiia bacterium]
MRGRRVVQWATGNIGLRALRHVIEHPGLDLVGVRVYDPEKVGTDAGELCGLASVGVEAVGDDDAVVALRPDCVLYMPREADASALCRLLEAGINVVSTCGTIHHPPSMDPGLRSRLEEACERGGATIHATGSSPGFITEAVPLVLASIQRRLDHLTIDEFANLSQRPSPDLLFGQMGFGRPLAEMDPRRFTHGRESFGPSLRLVADALSIPLDDLVAGGEMAVAARTVDIAAGTIEAGKVAAQRITVGGMRNGREVLTFRATWYCTEDIEPSWPLMSTGWRVSVEGDAPLEVDLRFPVTLSQMASVTPGYTANRAVNAVPMVCDAAPGIRTTLDLPPIVPVLS